MWMYFSGVAGGGVHGKVVGIVHVTTTGDGPIMTVSQVFILMSTRVGEGTTETIIGTTTVGTTSESLTSDFRRTGRAGMISDTGEGREPGVFRVIVFRLNNEDRNSDIGENRSIIRGPTFDNMSSGEKSNTGKENIEAEKAGRIEVEKVEKVEAEKAERAEEGGDTTTSDSLLPGLNSVTDVADLQNTTPEGNGYFGAPLFFLLPVPVSNSILAHAQLLDAGTS
jgi:hypothetical protein